MISGLEEDVVLGSPRLRVARRRGSGARLLMLHGVLRCGADFSPMLPFLDPTLDIAWLDQRGHGASERATGYRVTDYVADALRVVDALGADGLTVYGHSLGAMVAAAVAERCRVARVILEDPPFATMGGRIEGSVWQQVFVGFREALEEQGAEGTRNSDGERDGLLRRLGRIPVRVADGSVVLLSSLRDEASLRWSAECLARVDAGVLDPLIGGTWLEGFAWEGLLERANCPVLSLEGDERAGGALCPEDAVTAGAGAEHVTRVRFEGRGHQLHATDPEGISRWVNDFVHGSARSGGPT